MKRCDVPNELIIRSTFEELIQLAVIQWGIILSIYLAIFIFPWYTYPLLCLLLAARYQALGVILHDLTHLPYSRNTIKVMIIEVLTGYPIVSTIDAMRYHHLRHHRDVCFKTDPYIKISVHKKRYLYLLYVIRGLLLFPFWSIRSLVGTVSLYVPKLRMIYAKIFLQDRESVNIHQKDILSAAKAEKGLLLYCIIMVTLLTIFPRIMLLLYFIPISISGMLNAHRVIMEHDHEIKNDRSISSIITSTNTHTGVLKKLFLYPLNIGYHTAHHIHPLVGLKHLPALHEWYMNNNEKYKNNG